MTWDRRSIPGSKWQPQIRQNTSNCEDDICKFNKRETREVIASALNEQISFGHLGAIMVRTSYCWILFLIGTRD